MKFLTTDSSSLGMLAEYQIDPVRRMRIEEYRGRVGLKEMKAVLSKMVSDPRWSPEYHGLVDFSEVILDLSANDVLRLALVLRHEENRSNGWLVFVAPDATTYGVVRMLGYWSRNTERLRIFPNRDEAESWLARHTHLMPSGFNHDDDIESGELFQQAV